MSRYPSSEWLPSYARLLRADAAFTRFMRRVLRPLTPEQLRE